ncbi:MAG: citramalate synthase [bacterium]
MKIELYDTTLRDGCQMDGISFSLQDKIAIARIMDNLEISYIEGGWPSSNPKDELFFKEIKKERLKSSKIVAFGSTAHPKYKPDEDLNLQGLIDAKTEIITIFGKTSPFHIKNVLRVSLDRNLEIVEGSIKFLRKKGKRVFFDCEHFFDGYKDNPKYAKRVIEVAINGGCEIAILCDTNGGSYPEEIEKIIKELKTNFPLGIHTHNDRELAVANSISAVMAGCRQVQGTMNGYGERCGNANLITLIPNLYKLGILTIKEEKLKSLTETSRIISEIANIAHSPHQPYVGQSAFAHKAGVHSSAVMKHPETYEHINPELVGNTRKMIVSELAGTSSIIHKASEYQISFSKEETKKVLKIVKEMENQGYQFEAADGSFELLIDKALGLYKPSFNIKEYGVIVENEGGRLTSKATVKIEVEGKEEYTVAEGDGPVNALDKAIRKALYPFYPELLGVHLTDYKVRVLDTKEGTAAKVRVLIESSDKKGSWGTVGVSENIIDASCHALIDAIEYALLKRKEAYIANTNKTNQAEKGSLAGVKKSRLIINNT